MKRRLVFLALTTGFAFHPAPGRAQWPTDGVVLSSALNDQTYPEMASDGSGGAIVTWEDYRSGTDHDIYVQRVNALGVTQWTTDGVALCTATGDQLIPTIASDGAGGAIVTWYDLRNGSNHTEIYAQRVNASGVPQWTGDGVALCTAANNRYYPTIVPDDAGGAIVTWEDQRNGNDDIYAQRVNASGAAQWTADGVALCSATGDQYRPTIAPDGGGGAIVTWYDYRVINDANIYAQRVNASGVAQWTADGVALCTAANEQNTPEVVSDGAGGAIVTWNDFRSGTDNDVYARRVDASGTVLWTTDGVALCTASGDQMYPTLASDGAGGAIVAWYDYRSGTQWEMYAQRVSASGVVQWASNGVTLSTAANDQMVPTPRFPRIDSDGAGGAIVVWHDFRSGTGYDIYAQRINALGTVQWAATGVALSSATNSQINPTIVSDGGGGAIAAWEDHRDRVSSDIYAQRVGPSGEIPTAVHSLTPSLLLAVGENYPNPFSAGTSFDVTLRHAADVNVEVFDAAGRRVRSMDVGRLSAGTSRLAFDGRDGHARALASGVYFLRVHAGGGTVTRKMVITR